MNSPRTRRTYLLTLLAGALAMQFTGCESANKKVSATSAPVAAARAEKGGAELWSETCARCHNMRSPSSYGPRQWEVAVYDMRVRANLTGEEQRKITEFLKAASQ